MRCGRWRCGWLVVFALLGSAAFTFASIPPTGLPRSFAHSVPLREGSIRVHFHPPAVAGGRLSAIGFQSSVLRYSADPVGIDSFPNLYAYANLNPAFFVDPYGLCAESDLSYQMRVFGETGAMTAARTFASPSTARTGMDTLQTGIAALSALDPTPVTPAVNAMISIARGNTAMAAMSVVAMIPLMGEAERLGVAGERLGVQAMGTAGEAEAFAGIREASQFLRGAGVPRAARVQILQSFEASTVQVDQAGANQFGIRYFGGNANEVGSFLFDTFPASRQSLALRPEFNAMTGFRQLQIRPAANVISGRVAAQGVGFEGGQMQRFILNPEENLLFP